MSISLEVGYTLHDFEKEVLSTSVFRFYDEGEFLTAKKLSYKFGDKICYSGFKSPVYKILESTGFR